MSSEIPVQTVPLLPVEEAETPGNAELADDAEPTDGAELANDAEPTDTEFSDGAQHAEPTDADFSDSTELADGALLLRRADQPDDQLASDPFTDDLTSELATAAGKRWGNRATAVLVALALIVVGFLGGALVQKNYGKSTTAADSTTRRTFPGAFPTGGFQRGAGTGTGTGGAGSEQSGTVVLVDGSTIYVKLANGDTVTVKTGADTKVSLASKSKVSALKKGQQVTFTGATDSSTGTVTATSVTAAK